MSSCDCHFPTTWIIYVLYDQALDFTLEGTQQFSFGTGHLYDYEENVNFHLSLTEGTTGKAEGTMAIALGTMGHFETCTTFPRTLLQLNILWPNFNILGPEYPQLKERSFKKYIFATRILLTSLITEEAGCTVETFPNGFQLSGWTEGSLWASVRFSCSLHAIVTSWTFIIH